MFQGLLNLGYDEKLLDGYSTNSDAGCSVEESIKADSVLCIKKGANCPYFRSTVNLLI